jgi:hypothetical protein
MLEPGNHYEHRRSPELSMHNLGDEGGHDRGWCGVAGLAQAITGAD